MEYVIVDGFVEVTEEFYGKNSASSHTVLRYDWEELSETQYDSIDDLVKDLKRKYKLFNSDLKFEELDSRARIYISKYIKDKNFTDTSWEELQDWMKGKIKMYKGYIILNVSFVRDATSSDLKEAGFRSRS